MRDSNDKFKQNPQEKQQSLNSVDKTLTSFKQNK